MLLYFPLLTVTFLLAFCRGQTPATKRDLIILTDMEPDDRIALAMVASRPELASRLLFVGTTLLNSKLKAVLAERQLAQTGLGPDIVPVHVGSGGHPNSYPNQVATAKAAFKFWEQEGEGILPEEEMRKYRESAGEEDALSDEQALFNFQTYEEIWSVDMEGMPESKASKPADRHIEDQQAVLKVMDLLQAQIPPRAVYRIPKPRGILSTAPRPLKVLFAVGSGAPLLQSEWRKKQKQINQMPGLENLVIFSGLGFRKFNEIKRSILASSRTRRRRVRRNNDEEVAEQFFDAKERMDNEDEEEEQEGIEEKAVDVEKEVEVESDDHFYDFPAEDNQLESVSDKAEIGQANDQKKKRRKKNKKQMEHLDSIKEEEKEKEFYEDTEKADQANAYDDDNENEWKTVTNKKERKGKLEEMAVGSSSHQQQKMESRIDSTNMRAEAASFLADMEMEMIRDFLDYEEEERSILIKGLPDYRRKHRPAAEEKEKKLRIIDNQQHKSSPPPLLPSERYRGDFDAVTELLYALGVETEPLAVVRLGSDVDKRGERNMQVIFRSRKLVEIVLQSWLHYSDSTRSAKPFWQRVLISDFGHHRQETMLDESEITSRKHTLDMFDHFLGKRASVNNNSNVVSDVSNLANNLKVALINALGKAEENSLEILLMTAPTDLVQVLEKYPELCRAIKRVHVMGGWVDLKIGTKTEKPPPTVWGNYNLNMAPQSSRRLFAMASEGMFPMRLYTYRHIWEMFQGSVNSNKFEKAINTIVNSELEVFTDFLKAAKSWDENAVKLMPYLSRFIGKFAGQQFSPTDPILVIGLLNPKAFITGRRHSVDIKIAQEELDSLRDVLEVQIEYNQPTSKIELITGLAEKAFRKELEQSLDMYRVKCFHCGKFGHLVQHCQRTEKQKEQNMLGKDVQPAAKRGQKLDRTDSESWAPHAAQYPPLRILQRPQHVQAQSMAPAVGTNPSHQQEATEGSRGKVECFHCGDFGHLVQHCQSKEKQKEQSMLGKDVQPAAAKREQQKLDRTDARVGAPNSAQQHPPLRILQRPQHGQGKDGESQSMDSHVVASAAVTNPSQQQHAAVGSRGKGTQD